MSEAHSLVAVNSLEARAGKDTSMDYQWQVQRGIDFIEEHLTDEIDLRDVSRVAGVSHWHFLRMFKALTNETLKSYIRSRRLADARRSLVTSDDSIITIALAAGFESQEAFTRASSEPSTSPLPAIAVWGTSI